MAPKTKPTKSPKDKKVENGEVAKKPLPKIKGANNTKDAPPKAKSRPKKGK